MDYIRVSIYCWVWILAFIVIDILLDKYGGWKSLILCLMTLFDAFLIGIFIKMLVEGGII
jgi:uncharacterized membrane protein